MANSPVLNRPMFQQSSPLDVSVGLGSMSTPDQNAQELRNMFAPAVPSQPPMTQFPVPQQNAYKRGGEVINGVAHFQAGGESMSFDPMGNPTGYAAPAPDPVPERIAERLMREENRPRVEMPAVDPMGNVTGGVMSVPVSGRTAPTGPVSGSSVIIPANTAYPGRGDPNFNEPPADVPDFRPGKAVPTPAKPPADLELQLQSIKARRESSEKQREENKWMGLLAAGLGMMASKSKTFAGGVGEGGLEGLRSFQASEKGRREDEATARREDLLTRQLAQQKEIAYAQLAQDPDTVRLYKALGGGDLMKGYQLASADATIKSAQLIAADYTAPEADRAKARAFLTSRIEEASGARSGGSNLPAVRLISK